MKYPRGWVVHLNSYLTKRPDNFMACEEEFKRMEELFPSFQYLAFGNFDQVELVPIDRFSDYREEFVTSYHWLGKRQSIMLYAISDTEDDYRERFGYECSDQNKIEDETERISASNTFIRYGDGKRSGRFLIYTLLHMSGSAKASIENYSDYLVLIRKGILDLVECYRGTKINRDEILHCEVFGTLNSAEVAIMWEADQFVDVLDLTDHIRNMRFSYDDMDENGNHLIRKICHSSYSIISENMEREDDSWEEVKGNAFLQFESTLALHNPGQGNSINNTHSSDETKCSIQTCEADFAKQFIEECLLANDIESQVCYSAGEYDFVAKIAAKDLKRLFPMVSYCNEENAARLANTFSTHNEKLVHCLNQTTTRLIYSDDDIAEGIKEIEWENWLRIHVKKNYDLKQYNTDILNGIEFIQEDIGKRRKKLEELQEIISRVAPYSGLEKMVSLLYSDYVKILCTSIDHLWIKDYDEQFRTIFDLILSRLKWYENQNNNGGFSKKQLHKDSTELLGQIEKLGDILQQQAEHILESSKLFLEPPNSNKGYTAQFDFVLHAYYGFVKEFISMAYEGQRNSWQYTLVPVINFSNTPIIKSSMVYDVKQDLNSARLVSFQMPYDTWSNPLLYLPFLVHENYHYIAPVNRNNRNKSILVVLLFVLCSEVLTEALSLFEQGDSIWRRWIEVDFQKHMYEIIEKRCHKYYDEVKRRIYYKTREACHDDLPAYLLSEAVLLWLRDTSQNMNENGILQVICETTNQDFQKDLEQYPYDYSQSDHLKEYTREFNKQLRSKEKEGLLWKAWQRKIDKCEVHVKGIVEQLREILPDQAMIKWTSMDLIDYLVQFVILQEKLLQSPEMLTMARPIWWRVGSIIDYFMKHIEKKDAMEYLDEHKKEFQILYYHLIQCTIEKNMYQNEEDLEKGKEKFEMRAIEWLHAILRLYENYCSEYSICRKQLLSLVEGLGDDIEKGNKRCRAIKELYHDYWIYLRQEKNWSAKMFDLNLKLIQIVQNQHALGIINQRGKDRINPTNKTEAVMPMEEGILGISPEQIHHVLPERFLDKPSNLLKDLEEAVGYMRKLHEEALGIPCRNDSLWYRGVSNASYHVVPSLFVNYYLPKYNIVISEKGEDKLIKPAMVLEHLYERFKFKADGAPEMISQASYQISDYFALMQHYQQPTTFLDWSEDAFAALYFALEDGFKGNSLPESDAAIYIFDPELYNMARRRMITYYYNNGTKVPGKQMSDLQAIAKTAFADSEGVPNVSIKMNAELFSVCIDPLKCSLYEAPIKVKEIEDAKLGKFIEEIYKLPIAIYTSRLNPRIKAQSGQFVVFHPHTRPVITDSLLQNQSGDDKTHGFDYMSLDKIQDYYLAEFSRIDKQPVTPFLFKLTIHSGDKATIAEKLRGMGIKTAHYYPELSNEQF